MIERMLSRIVREYLGEFPAVALLGPRQVGKTTLALEIGRPDNALYLDLESERDKSKLALPEEYLWEHRERLVILDEVHRLPGLFPLLRGLIDRKRREGKGPGGYLLLGSATPDLLRQSGESLAGRIAYLELSPLGVIETGRDAINALWLRGGYPESFLASDSRTSFLWREHFLRTYLERDIPQFGFRIAAETLRRFWGMLAHNQGGLLNTSNLARNIGVDVKTAGNYLDLLADLYLVRRLPPWHANLGKRLVKSPKVYVRDSGLVHALLGIVERESLLGHPVVGASWESFAIENLLVSVGDRARGFFYRTSGGAEIDLLLEWPDQTLWAIEVKRSFAPKPDRGFYSACLDLSPVRKYVVYPGEERIPLPEGIVAISLFELAREIRETSRT